MKSNGFIHVNKAQFACTLVTKQSPINARLSCKRKAYRVRLVPTKLREATEKLGAIDWEVPDADGLMLDNLIKFVQVAVADFRLGEKLLAH